MRIYKKQSSRKPLIKASQGWRAAGAVLVLGAAFLLGYISQPGWTLASAVESAKKALIKADRAVVEDVRQEMGLYNANGLATIFLDIPFESLLSIEQKRTEALSAGILLTSDDDFVPASMHLNDGPSFPIKIRLKGDWTDHLVGDKWSFRIHIDDDQSAVLGMRRFSIQAPETRNYEKEWVYHQNLFQEGLLTTRYYFVNVVQNGKYNGIYALEESFTEDLLESQGRREGPIIRFSEDLLWKNWENLGTFDSDLELVSQQIGKFWLTDAGSSEITAFRQNHLTKDELLSGELFSAIEMLSSFNQGLLPGEEVFDLELWGKYFALTDLWGAGHSTSWINLRFYYNPVTSLLEPVVFDALPLEPSATRERLAFPFAEQGYIQQIFRLPAIQASYVSNLERITSPAYLANLEDIYGAEMDRFHAILTGYLERGVLGDIPPLPWEELRMRAAILARNLRSPQPIQGSFQIVQIDNRDTLRIELTNLMVLPVELQTLSIDGESLAIDPSWCPTSGCQDQLLDPGAGLVAREYTSLTLLIPLDDLASELSAEPSLSIGAVLFGGSTATENPLTANYQPAGIAEGPRPRTSLDYALQVHPFLQETVDGSLAVEPGSWEVYGDLIIPEGLDLAIPAGTTLRFGPGAILLVTGSLDLHGVPDHPVTLTSRAASWGGIAVLGNQSTQSSWTDAIVENTSGIIRGGWVLTGGITFYEHKLSLTRITITGSTAEDSLNAIRSEIAFDDILIKDAASDAFDGDFIRGTITNSRLENVAGDGLDFSGSTVAITATNFRAIGDKAVSVGEHSLVSITDCTIHSTNIGVASKDLSEVTVDSVEISGAKVAGLAAYQKKAQYGPASLSAERIAFSDTAVEALCQIGSTVVVSGKETPCQEVDVEALYAQGVLGN